MKNLFFEQNRNFSALDERDCQAAWLFAHLSPFGRQRRAWPDGADPTHFHMHIGKIGQFFRIRVFPSTDFGLCAYGPYNTTGDLQNTPGTPAIHFPLVAAGSQSALYAEKNDFCKPSCALMLDCRANCTDKSNTTDAVIRWEQIYHRPTREGEPSFICCVYLTGLQF